MMKSTIALLLAFTVLSCNSPSEEPNHEEQDMSIVEDSNENYSDETFESINTDEINQLLAGKTDLTPTEVMGLHYPTELEFSEGNESIDITEKTLANGNILVTLIHDHLMDDSQMAEKQVMELTQSNGQWNVVALKRNWKCREGRGHTDWGIDLCL